MKKYKFKLETVLDVKKHREEILEGELSRLETLFAQGKECLAQLEQKRAYYQTQLPTQEHMQLQIQAIQDQLEYLDYLAGEISKQKQELENLAKLVEEKRASLTEASQERQLLEEVKEKGRRAHIKEYHRQEQNFLDEIAQLGFCRKEAGLYT